MIRESKITLLIDGRIGLVRRGGMAEREKALPPECKWK